MSDIRVTDVCTCKHFHIFYMTDHTKMCDLYGECLPFINKIEKETCKDFDNVENENDHK